MVNFDQGFILYTASTINKKLAKCDNWRVFICLIILRIRWHEFRARRLL